MSLNVENLNLINDHCKTKMVCWGCDRLSAAVAAVAFSLWRGRGYIPRKFDVVMEKFATAIKCGESKWHICVTGTVEDITELVKDILFDIKEFREWNLTTLEHESEVDVDNDAERKSVGIFENSNKDFIDLDAFMQNIYCELRRDLIEELYFEI